jgi:putative membrane protein
MEPQSTAGMTEADHVRVTEAVHAAESGTAGEIVTIVADASDRYLDVAVWISATFGVIAMTVIAALPGFASDLIRAISGGWGEEPSIAEALELSLATFVLVFIAARLLLLWRPLLIALTPGIVKTGRVHRRAVRYFKVGAERRTTGRTGILIYLSLAERRAEIVADEAIHKVVPKEDWGQAMADLIVEVKEGRIADGMIAAVRDVGLILAQHLPRADDDSNELPDRLIEL